MSDQRSTTTFSTPFWAELAGGVLTFQRCERCGNTQLYPRRRCLECGSFDLLFDAASGRGRLYTFSVIHKYPPSDFVEDLPYVLGIVKLDEGPRLLTQIVNCIPDDLRCDLEVVCSPSKVHGILLPTFAPANELGTR